MRFLALFPLACAIIAFVLSILCIFAGSRPGFMEDTALMTLNSSMLGEFAFNTTSSSPSNDTGGLLGDLENHLHHFESDIENDILNALKTVAHDIAEALKVHDFYSVHLLNYCEGYYEPGPLVNSTNSNPWENVTQCSNQTSFFTFHPAIIIQSELIPGVNLTFLKWPSEIEDAIDGVEVALRTMFVMYCLGVAFAGVAVIAAIVAFFLGGTLGVVINCMLDTIAFLALGIASAISTVAIVKIVGAVNQYGNGIGVAAYQGSKFLALTWVSTALMGLAAIGWVVECCVGRKRKVHAVRDGKSSRI